MARAQRGAVQERAIHYYVLGARTFKQTTSWPPADAKMGNFWFGENRSLTRDPPAKPFADRYSVDFNATTGDHTRWSEDPQYGDRREEDKKLLVYDSAPMTEDMELVGTPVATIYLASATRDPAIHLYLEDVAPDGRVTYLTEGVFRAVHRKLANRQVEQHGAGLAPHTYLKGDAQPMPPRLSHTEDRIRSLSYGRKDRRRASNQGRGRRRRQGFLPQIL